jgi:hypothetical protein
MPTRHKGHRHPAHDGSMLTDFCPIDRFGKCLAAQAVHKSRANLIALGWAAVSAERFVQLARFSAIF